MNIEQSELLIRVDQNVINLVDLVKSHIIDDKKFQDETNIKLASLNESRARARGVIGFASVLWGLIGAFFGVKYGSR